MNTRRLRKVALGVAGVVAVGWGAASAKAASCLWISAPTWSYSSAAAESPIGWAYFWGLSVGAGTYSFAYAYSHDGVLGSADAFAEASAGNLGGMGAVDVSGLFADPYAGVGIDISLTDPSNAGGYPTSKPGSNPFSSAYTVSATGITLTGSGQELHGVDELQAFVYNGNTDLASLEAALGASSDSGTSSSGDVTDLSALATDFGLIPLDPVITDPGSLTGITFTENDTGLNTANVILVGMANAAVPLPPALPAGLALMGMVGVGALWRKRRPAAMARPARIAV